MTAPRGPSEDLTPVQDVYFRWLDAWNARSASGMAGLLEEDANVIGFDGSQIDGRAAVEAEMGRIFTDHQTAEYIAKVREVRLLSPDVALLRAVVGMVPRGQADLNPAVNAIQTIVAVRRGDRWRIGLFQNTPAQFHGRPELAQQLTDELRQALREPSNTNHPEH